MVLDKANGELLKLIAICRDVSCERGYEWQGILGETNIGRLIAEGLLYISRDGRYYRVTQVGYDLLNSMGHGYQPDTSRESDKRKLEHRDMTAQVMMTLLLAGIDVSASDISEVVKSNVYLAASGIRRLQWESKQNSISNSRIKGLTKDYVFYYITEPNGILYYKNETKTAMDLLNRAFRDGVRDMPAETIRQPSVVYMGADYPYLCAAVTRPKAKGHSYRSAYDSFKQPVYLCPCGPDGAFQMRVMLQPDYRARLINVLFPNGCDIGGESDYGGCDGLYKGEPFIVGIDMDLRRMSDVIKAAGKRGVKTHIFARQCQCDALRGVFRDHGVRLYRLEDAEIMDAFSFSMPLLEPSGREPYYTKEGRCISDEDIQACREARKACRKKAKAAEKVPHLYRDN